MKMSCVHYQSMDPSRERSCYDGHNQYNRYSSTSCSPRIRASDNYRSGYCASWRTLEFQGSNIETPTPVKSDPIYTDTRSQSTRCTANYKTETMKHDEQQAIEKMQTKMKFLEDSNIVMQTRNQNLITENKALMSRLKDEQNERKKLEKKIASVEEELESERSKLEEIKKEAKQTRNASLLKANGTSTTNIVAKNERGVQIWAVCMACQRKLEGCEKQPSTVVITKSELEVLEKDMQTLRDTIIAREEAWDKAMEREQNYRQQLTRLTTETITARHLSETRYEELKRITNALSEKESELKSLQKENLSLNKLILKLHNSHQRIHEGCTRSNALTEINDKDQKIIEDIVRRTSNSKTKQKPKSKSACFERTPHFVTHQSNPRDRSARTTKEHTGLTRESKR